MGEAEYLVDGDIGGWLILGEDLVVRDNLMHLYYEINPVFVGNYRNARIIVDGGGGHNPPPPPPTH